MFNRVPADVSEIVVVYSRSYELYREMKEIVEKFKDKSVQERICDKLTIKKVNESYISYRLQDECYRAYDKPLYMSFMYSETHHHVYQWANRCNKSNMPNAITFEGNRYYEKHIIHGRNSLIYYFGNVEIWKCGVRWFKNRPYNRYNILR